MLDHSPYLAFTKWWEKAKKGFLLVVGGILGLLLFCFVLHEKWLEEKDIK